jgi:hypothetical protein
MYTMPMPPNEGDRCKVHRGAQHIATGTVSSVDTDSDYGFVVYMTDLVYADGGRADHAEFLGGVYKFECGAAGGRRRKSRKSRKSRKTRRSSRK